MKPSGSVIPIDPAMRQAMIDGTFDAKYGYKDKAEKKPIRKEFIPEITSAPIYHIPQFDTFAPPTLADFIGQEDTKKLVKIIVGAAKLENRPLPNILLAGGFGLGKSTLASLITKEYGASYKILDGGNLYKEKNLSGNLIIDEIHNTDPITADSLNMLIDQGVVHIIGATTNPGLLGAPFRSRFRLLTLKRYNSKELSLIARKICQRKGVSASSSILSGIANRSRSNARQLTVLLSTIFDLTAVKKVKEINKQISDEAFQLLGIDTKGYTATDKAYVGAMPEQRPIGIGALSAILGIDGATIEQEIEPFLLQTGVIDRTPRGRVKLKGI